MKINKKIKDQIQKVLFEFRLGLDDIEDQQKIRYSMFNKFQKILIKNLIT